MCSVASVFTTLINSIKEKSLLLSEEQRKCVSDLCVHFVRSNLASINFAVVPELHNEAYNILCNFWGEGLVKIVEARNK